MTITDGETYIEDTTSHTITFDVDITLGSTTGAVDNRVNRWSLRVCILRADDTVIAGPYDLSRNMATTDGSLTVGQLTPAQADLIISAGETKTMTGVEFKFNPSALGGSGLCPDTSIDINPDDRYKLKVEVRAGINAPGAVNPPTPYTIVGTGASPETYINQENRLDCTGKLWSIGQHVLKPLLLENLSIETDQHVSGEEFADSIFL